MHFSQKLLFIKSRLTARWIAKKIVIFSYSNRCSVFQKNHFCIWKLLYKAVVHFKAQYTFVDIRSYWKKPVPRYIYFILETKNVCIIKKSCQVFLLYTCTMVLAVLKQLWWSLVLKETMRYMGQHTITDNEYGLLR